MGNYVVYYFYFTEQGNEMQNVTVKQLDQVLTQLNEVLAKLASRIEALEEANTAKPTKTAVKRGTKSE